MRRWLWVLLAAACAAQGPPLGIVTSVSGDARILEPGAKKPRPVEIADVLESGTLLTTGPNARISFVFCPDATAQLMNGRTTLQFSKATFAVNAGTLGPARRVPSCRIPVASASLATTHVGGVNMRGQASLRLVSPSGTSTAPGALRFVWKPVETASVYRVGLGEDGGEEFWEAESKETFLAYAGDRKLALGGVYRWRVTALREDEVLSSASASFRVLSGEEWRRIYELKSAAISAEERHILLGMLYEEYNMPDLALEEYMHLKVTPGSRLEARVAGLRQRQLP